MTGMDKHALSFHKIETKLVLSHPLMALGEGRGQDIGDVINC